MNLVKTVEAGNANTLERLLLQAPHKLLPLLYGSGMPERSVENGAHFVLTDNVLKLLLIELEVILHTVVGSRLNGELGHLPDFLVERKFRQERLYLLLHLWVRRDGRGLCFSRQCGCNG